MVFSLDPARSCAWWADVLGLHARSGDGFHWVDTAVGVELGLHPADPVNSPRGASTVPYWKVSDFDRALARLDTAEAARHRGPLTIDPGRRIAQVRDPFGAVIGLQGH